MAATIIPFELPLPKVLPTIEGNVDYRTLRDQLLQINQMLVVSGLEDQMIEADLKQWLQGRSSVSAKAQQNRQLHARRALRCNIARLLLKEDYRGLATRLADSPLFPFFCGIGEVDRGRRRGKTPRAGPRWLGGRSGSGEGPRRNCSRPGPNNLRNSTCQRPSIWRPAFWTQPVWKPISIILWTGYCCETARAL